MPDNTRFEARIYEIVQQTVLFRGLPPAQVEQVLAAARLAACREGAFFFVEGDPARNSYALVSGQVRLSQVSAEGQQVLMGYIGAGREFGIIAALGELAYPVSAQAVSDSQALVWDSQKLNELLEAIPAITRNALFIMARQIKEFQSRIRELSTQRVERRIARTLVRLAQQAGRQTAEGVQIELPVTRQDLGEMSGTTLYTASRTLSQWETQGLVICGRERVVIRDLSALAQFADDLPPQG